MSSLQESLKIALNNELMGSDFYNKTAKEAEDEFTKNTFEHLAKDELYHIKRIKDFIESGEVEVEKEILERNPSSGLKFFEFNKEQFEKAQKKFEGEYAPYEFAIDIEIKSYDFYKKLFEESDNEKAKEFFKFLMKEEKTHRKMLEEALSFMQNPEDYFLETEGWSFD